MRTICPGEGCREHPKKQKRRCGNSSVAAAFLWPDSEKALKSRAFGQNEKVGNFCQNYLPFLAERKGFEPLCAFAQTDFECCKTMADSRLEQAVMGRFVKRQKRRRRKGLRTFRPVSARGDSNRPKVQIKPRSCVKSLRSCAFARSQARKQRPRQHR